MLFKNDMGRFVRLYSFLSQIFDYRNTDIKKRFLIFKLLILLLEFGRERNTVDLSKVVLTQHMLKNNGLHPHQVARAHPSRPGPRRGPAGVQGRTRQV